MIDSAQLQRTLGPLQLALGELAQFAEALVRRPRPAIRLRPDANPDDLPWPVERVPWSRLGCFLGAAARPSGDLRFAAADYYVQDAGSLLAVTLVEAEPGRQICDLCAAPGGKATAILDGLRNEGWLLVNEPIRTRLGVLRFQLSRNGVPRFAISQLDPQELAEAVGPQFDTVLVDAPCSGQSLLGRGKQTEAAFHPPTIAHCAARQARILDAAARLVRSNGRLVYSTCTFAYDENEGQIAAFLDRHPGWQLEPVQGLDDWQSQAPPGGYRLWPHRHGCGGAFAAALRFAGIPGVFAPRPSSRCRGRSLRSSTLPANSVEWGALTGAFVGGTEDRRFAWPEPPPDPLLDVAADGPEVAFRKGNTWFPAYSLAMRRDPQWSPRATAPLSDRQAADYLRGDMLSLSCQGWAVATWRGRSLGWLKGDGRRAKNHLPKPARLVV